MIEVKNLVKDYGDHVVVDHLNFTVEDGPIYGSLEPNGTGKSTMMNVMTGCLGVTEREIIVEGHNTLEEPKWTKQCIGYPPEIPSLYADMTVAEYLESAAKLKNIPKKERAAEILGVVEVTKLEGVSHRLIRNLSKGHKQRVSLAQAIFGMPSVIILDEPTMGLDPKQIIEICDLVKELGKQHTMTLSSHILSKMQAVCDKIMTIPHGRPVASDTPGSLEKTAGTHRMELTVKANETATLGILERTDAFEWMTDIVIRQGVKTGETEVSFQSESDGDYEKDIRETVFFAFAQAQVPILAMREKETSLEDVSPELIGDEKAAEEEQELLDSEEPDSELNGPEKNEEEAEDVNEVEDTITETDIIQETDMILETDTIPD